MYYRRFDLFGSKVPAINYTITFQEGLIASYFWFLGQTEQKCILEQFVNLLLRAHMKFFQWIQYNRNSSYRQPNKIMAYLTFHKWLVSVCNMHNYIWMVQSKTSHLGKVSYAIILLGWRYVWNTSYCRSFFALREWSNLVAIKPFVCTCKPTSGTDFWQAHNTLLKLV